MAAMQLSFTLRTSPNCQTVHLVGSWDSYQGPIPLSKDSRKAGAWKGNFRFQGATLQAGQRYWYYYIIDGYHVSHDPAEESVVEPTTGRQLNTLDIPASSSSNSSRSSRRHSREVAHGRPLSPSRIQHPRPQKPHATKQLRATEYSGHATVDELTQRFARSNLYADCDDQSDSEFESDDDDSDVPSLGSDCSSRPGSAASSNSSVSSSCSCDRYGITRRGDRVRLDCGGSRCGGKSPYDEDSCSEFESEDENQDVYYERSTRRQGVVVRGSRRH